MSTVFSHIVQKRLSRENEDIATEALALILQSSEAARSGLMKLLRGIVPELPSLWFRTQQAESNIRPDMCGFELNTPRVFIENKFWAGLTENQPVSYLRQLAEHSKSAVLLVVAPTTRQETMWRELLHRLDDDEVPSVEREPSIGVTRVGHTDIGPKLALTSWAKLLSTIEAELAEEPQRLNDLIQLRALCNEADREGFVPISPAELSDQRTPAFILQLNSIVQDSVELGITKSILSIDGLRPTSSWERTGRYISFLDGGSVGAWFGTEFRFWRQNGGTPLWLVFWPGNFGRSHEVRAVLEPWAHREGLVTVMANDQFGVGIDLVTGEEMEHVVRSVVDRMSEIAEQLSVLEPSLETSEPTED